MKKQLFVMTFLLATALCLPLRANETITIDGRAETGAKSSRDRQAPASSHPQDTVHLQIVTKLNEMQLDQKLILQQLADMKQELYAVKVRASRC